MSDPGPKALTEEQKLSLPAFVAALVLCIVLATKSLFFDSTGPIRWYDLGLSLAGALYACSLFFYGLLHLEDIRVSKWLIAFMNGLIISLAMFFEPDNARGISFVFISILIITQTIILGRWPTYLFAFICFLSVLLILQKSPPGSIFDLSIESLPYPVFAVLAVETICRLRKTVNMQVHRLKVLNMVARSVTSSLETRQVIALLNSAIQNALDAHTYYVGLIDHNEKSIHLELLYDDGEFFPPTDLPLENTLAGWVMRNRSSLLIENLPEEMPRLGIRRFVVGKPRASLSWMGTPLQTREQLFGLVAVASYNKNEFCQEDLDLLENIAQQATLAIDNANHHSQVEIQSQLDSLTGVLNHGSFIKNLEEKIIDSEVTRVSTSVIMLDIDKFKTYNDCYGHLVGDQVLSRLTEIIRSHLRDSDLVGRWGGEEFCIALPGADSEKAFSIARRIQQSLSEIEFAARDGSPITAPTVSQGIAVYPVDARETYALIDAADQRLYIAKNRGRNEIEPHQSINIEIESAA